MSQRIFSKAVRLARELADFSRLSQRHFSFICLRNDIVCTGVNNTVKTHPLAKKYGYLFDNIHSEMAAVLAWQLPLGALRHFDMINVRLDRKLNVMLSKPCEKCQNFLQGIPLRRVWYSTSGGFERFENG